MNVPISLPLCNVTALFSSAWSNNQTTFHELTGAIQVPLAAGSMVPCNVLGSQGSW